MSRLAKAGYIAATVVVVLASLGAYAVYRRLDGNVSVVKVNGLSHRSVYGALARSLSGLHAKNVTLLTMPTITDRHRRLAGHQRHRLRTTTPAATPVSHRGFDSSVYPCDYTDVRR